MNVQLNDMNLPDDLVVKYKLPITNICRKENVL